MPVAPARPLADDPRFVQHEHIAPPAAANGRAAVSQRLRATSLPRLGAWGRARDSATPCHSRRTAPTAVVPTDLTALGNRVSRDSFERASRPRSCTNVARLASSLCRGSTWWRVASHPSCTARDSICWSRTVLPTPRSPGSRPKRRTAVRQVASPPRQHRGSKRRSRTAGVLPQTSITPITCSRLSVDSGRCAARGFGGPPVIRLSLQPPGQVLFGPLFARCREQLGRGAGFHQLSAVQQRGVIRHARRLLQVVCHQHDRVAAPEPIH